MKPIQLIFCGVIAGAILGWLANSWISEGTAPEKDGLTSRGKMPAIAAMPTNPQARDGESGRSATSGDYLTRGIEAASLENRNLSNGEFGEKLAELLTGGISLEDQIQAEGMKRALDPARFAAFYDAYSKRTDLRDTDMIFNNMLIGEGQQFGKVLLDTMLNQYPEGFERMDSVLHGWAMGNPAEAVDWFNELPETHPRYDKVLQGLVWGLAAKDGPMAGEVLAAMSPSDKEKAMFGFSSSFIEAHGLSAFDDWAKSAPLELAPQAVRQACDFAARQAPSEYVPWFANHSATIGVRGEMLQGFDKWFAASAPEAVEWLANLPAESQGMQVMLAGRVSPVAKERFLRDHPDHPGADLLNSDRNDSAP